jgi:hypothetical protein
MVLVIPEKYRPNTDRKYRIGIQLYYEHRSGQSKKECSYGTSQKLHCHTIFLMIVFFVITRQYTIKPQHIRHLLGTYIPNDEDVSLLEQIAADKGRFSDESDRTLYGSAHHVEILRRST